MGYGNYSCDPSTMLFPFDMVSNGEDSEAVNPKKTPSFHCLKIELQIGELSKESKFPWGNNYLLGKIKILDQWNPFSI